MNPKDRHTDCLVVTLGFRVVSLTAFSLEPHRQPYLSEEKSLSEATFLLRVLFFYGMFFSGHD